MIGFIQSNSVLLFVWFIVAVGLLAYIGLILAVWDVFVSFFSAGSNYNYSFYFLSNWLGVIECEGRCLDSFGC